MRTIRLPNSWQPRPYQLPAWTAWERGVNREVLAWHRRAGKDDYALHKTAVSAHLRIGNYWHCLPEYAQARKAIWEAVNPHTGRRRIDEAFPHELRAATNKSEMTIEFKSGSTWRMVGSDRPDSLVGAPPIGIVFSEWALSNPSAWAYLAPILDENGGWASFISTPRGRNHFKSMLEMAQRSPGWFGERLTVADTGYPLDRVETQRQEYHSIFGEEAGDALIDQEYWCSFEGAILGAYWGKELERASQEGRVGADVPIDPHAPVHVAWDLGVGDSTALWFAQFVPGGINVVDWYEASGHGVEHYVSVKRDKGYDYGFDFVPHDAKVREFGSGLTRIETMIRLGLKPQLVPAHKLMDGINAVRQVLPQCCFDARCDEGVERLRQYRTEWDDDRKTFSNNPRHDWTSHSADSFRYLAMAYREVATSSAWEPRPGRLMAGPHSTVRMDDLWAEREEGFSRARI